MPASLKPLLIVEDDAELRETLNDVLTEAGFVVLLAADAAAASAMLTEGLRPPLIICDLHTPGDLTGRDLARRVRDDPKLTETTMAIMTGSTEQGGDLGCIFLRKPLDLHELIQLARDHCK